MSSRRLAPGSRVEEIVEAGHFGHLDRLDAVLAILDDYLCARGQNSR